MVNPKISVIVPVYNTGIYLEETLNSLVNQTIVNDIEVLMIDDGSTDESRYIIEKFALDYDNFHAYHKENEGQGIARNYGLKLAKGDYIHFMDSDDYIVPDAYEKLYDLISSKDYDFVVGNVMKFTDYTCWEDILFKNAFQGLNENTGFHSINEHPFFVWDSITCNKLFKKEFLQKYNIIFPNKKIFFEDVLVSFECYVNSTSFGFLNDYIYYWRFRKNLSSVTQHNDTVRNFLDRLEILHNIKKLTAEANLNENSLNILYKKWLVHDLKMYLRVINHFPSEYYEKIFKSILDLIGDIPLSVKENLPSYQKIMYKMIDEDDIDSLLYFAPLDNQLKDANYDFKLADEYDGLIDFYKDAFNEDLIVEKTNIENNDECIIISFDYKINYFSKNHKHELEALLIDEKGNVDVLEIKNNQILLPFALLENKKSVKILMKCSCDQFQKESFLRNNGRSSILFNNLDIEIAVGINRVFIINFLNMHYDKLIIDNIEFDGINFFFEGKSKNQVKMLIMENLMTFKKNSYPVDFNEDSFSFKIPYTDIINSPVKKWELKGQNLIAVSESHIFFRDYDKIKFSNIRNKIYIGDSVYDKFEELYNMDSKRKKLSKKNSKLKNKYSKLKNKYSKLNNKYISLKDKNSELENSIDEFKSRKIVKFADKFKF